jgi:AcrR family transcriptional regulator
MTTAEARATSASALRLVVTAERLFAEHGIDGVSLRQIAAEAGSGNNSAVHYHFGSKHGLIAAIFEHRLPQLINERRLLTARCDPDDLRSRFEAQFLPVLTLAEAADNRYVSFVEQLQRHEAAFGTYLADLPEEGRRSSDDFRRDLDRLLRHVDERVRPLRIAEAQALCLHAAADRERAVARNAAVNPFDVFVNVLIDGLTGFLSAPVSNATLRRLRKASDGGPPRPRLL